MKYRAFNQNIHLISPLLMFQQRHDPIVHIIQISKNMHNSPSSRILFFIANHHFLYFSKGHDPIVHIIHISKNMCNSPSSRISFFIPIPVWQRHLGIIVLVAQLLLIKRNIIPG
jgi:hypothetical protein